MATSMQSAGALAHGDAGAGAWIRSCGIKPGKYGSRLHAAIFRKELFDRLGALDERFESYLEDIDFGIRCATAGLTGIYVPEAVAYHTGSATLGRWHPTTVS